MRAICLAVLLAVTVLGMSVLAGPPETWLMETHDDFASIEDLDKALGPNQAVQAGVPFDVAGLGASSSVIARYRAVWSYRPEQAVAALPRAHYLSVRIYHAGSAETMMQARQRAERANADLPGITYEVVAGAEAGTYLVLTPMTSLRAIDTAIAKFPGALDSAPPAEPAHETLLFRMEPGLSFVSDGFLSADPEFWRSRTGVMQPLN